MAMSSILNADDIKKALDAFAGKALCSDKSQSSQVAECDERITVVFGPNVSQILPISDLKDVVATSFNHSNFVVIMFCHFGRSGWLKILQYP